MSNVEQSKALRCGVGDEWESHRREIDVMGRRVEKTYAEVKKMSDDTNNIADTLSRTSVVLENIKNDLIGPATGKGQVSLWSHLWTVLILGIIALVILVERSQKTTHFGATALTPEVTIGNTDEPAKEAKDDAPKT